MDLFLLHCFILIWVSIGTVRYMIRQVGDQLLASALLVWGNFVATRLLLVVMDRLGDPVWIIGVSLLLAVVFWWSLSRLVSAPAQCAPKVEGPGKWAVFAFSLTLLPLAARMLSRCFLDQPGNPDVLKAMAWSLTGLCLYRLGRVLTLKANVALTLSWLGLVAGFALAQFDPTAHVTLATTGVITGLVFAWQWKQDRSLCHAMLGSLAAIIVAGGLSGHLLPNLRWSGSQLSRTATVAPAPNNQRVFLQDLVLSPNTGPVRTEGLRPADGPFPLLDLPRFCSVRQPSMRIIIPAQAESARLRIRFSLGLHQRNKTEIVLLFNGNKLKHYRLTRQEGWLDDTLEFDVSSGENILEFLDVSHQQELDWRDYLERYSDVMLYLDTNNIPLEEGALEHYQLSGQPEGRIMLTREITPPVRGAYYFVFRLLQLEGLQ